MNNTSYSAEAALLYARDNKRIQPVLNVIQAIIDGYTVREIITRRVAPTLSVRTIQYYFYKYKSMGAKNGKK